MVCIIVENEKKKTINKFNISGGYNLMKIEMKNYSSETVVSCEEFVQQIYSQIMNKIKTICNFF